MIPDFLGIGFQRCGTTWLHDLLDAHPDVYVPQRRKEIHFFSDDWFANGWDWYEGFFPDDAVSAEYQAVGEVSPMYVYHREALQRIANETSIQRFLVMVREPVSMLESVHRWHARVESNPVSFEQRWQQNGFFRRGPMFYQTLAPWLAHYDPSCFCVIALEEVRRNPAKTRERIAAFLGVDPARFPPQAGEKSQNVGTAPRFRKAYQLATRAHVWLRRRDLDAPVRWLKRLGVKRLFGQAAPSEPLLSAARRHELSELYAEDARQLAETFQLDLAAWRPSDAETAANERSRHV